MGSILQFSALMSPSGSTLFFAVYTDTTSDSITLNVSKTNYWKCVASFAPTKFIQLLL